MTDDAAELKEKRLLAIARTVVPTWWKVRTMHDETAVGVVYTLETTDSKGVSRWFALPEGALRSEVSDAELARQLARAVKPD